MTDGPWVWLDGELLPTDEARVAPSDHGLLLGDGVFETLRATGGRAELLDAHLARLRRSAEAVALGGLPDDATLAAAVHAVLGATGADPARVRLTVTSGRGPDGPARGTGGPTVLVTASAPPPLPPTVRAVTAPWPRNERSPLAAVKSTSYAEQLALLRHARGAGVDECLVPDTRGRLSEAATANVFVVVDGRLRTPSTASGCLPGVMRALVRDATGAEETDVAMEALGEATEIFLTSSLRLVQPVVELDGRPLDPAGPHTTRAREAVVAHLAGPGREGISGDGGAPRPRR